jgi:hypothetical protein
MALTVSTEVYRNSLRDSREEFLASDQVNDMDFPQWLEDKYGFKMIKNSDGYYIMDYDVLDEKAFLLFQIKYFSA